MLFIVVVINGIIIIVNTADSEKINKQKSLVTPLIAIISPPRVSMIDGRPRSLIPQYLNKTRKILYACFKKKIKSFLYLARRRQDLAKFQQPCACTHVIILFTVFFFCRFRYDVRRYISIYDELLPCIIMLLLCVFVFSSYSDAAKHRPKYDGGGQLAVR